MCALATGAWVSVGLAGCSGFVLTSARHRKCIQLYNKLVERGSQVPTLVCCMLRVHPVCDSVSCACLLLFRVCTIPPVRLLVQPHNGTVIGISAPSLTCMQVE